MINIPQLLSEELSLQLSQVTNALQLQEEGGKSFSKSWDDLMSVINSKCDVLRRAS